MYKLLFRLTRPAPFGAVSLSALVAVLLDPLRGCFLGFFPAILMFCNLIFYLADQVAKRRKGSDAVKDNLIQVYVDDATYDRLHQIIDGHNVSLPEFCCMVLECVDPVELEAAIEAQED